MKKLLLALLLLPTPALADELMWDAPATRVDGSELLSTEIKEYRVYNNGTLLGVSEGNEVQFKVPAYGPYKFTVATVDTEGRESEQSDPLVVTVRARPGKPSKVILKLG